MECVAAALIVHHPTPTPPKRKRKSDEDNESQLKTLKAQDRVNVSLSANGVNLTLHRLTFLIWFPFDVQDLHAYLLTTARGLTVLGPYSINGVLRSGDRDILCDEAILMALADDFDAK